MDDMIHNDSIDAGDESFAKFLLDIKGQHFSLFQVVINHFDCHFMPFKGRMVKMSVLPRKTGDYNRCFFSCVVDLKKMKFPAETYGFIRISKDKLEPVSAQYLQTNSGAPLFFKVEAKRFLYLCGKCQATCKITCEHYTEETPSNWFDSTDEEE